jgi:hypothetical protein
MPLWLQKLLSRPSDAALLARHGHDPEWAEFNLPARGDLLALLHDERAGNVPHNFCA